MDELRVFIRKYARYAPLLFVALLALVCAGIWIAVVSQTPHGVLTFALLDIGQGDALYIESPTGQQVLVDSGPDSSVLGQLPHVMPLFDRSIDVAIETHPDADHIGGFTDVLSRYTVGAFIEPGIYKDNQTNDALEKAIGDEHVPRYIARRGMRIDIGGGAYLQVLSPDRDVTHMNPNVDNDGGIVMRLVYGSTTALLTADVDSDIEDRLLAEDGTSLKSDILKVPHHGSRTSSESAFIAAVSPQVAAISVGAHNKYGHPNLETLARYAANNIPVVRTDQSGTIVFESDGEKFWQEH